MHTAQDVRFESVVVRYPGADRNAVDGVSAHVPAGSFTVLLGPSGCGKSTLLRTVNRLVVPQSGDVLVGNESVAAQIPVELRRKIGYVIQAVGLFAHMTVAQNIAVVPSLLNWDRSRTDARVDELLQLGFGARPENSAAGNDQRALGSTQQPKRVVDQGGISAWP